MRYPEYALPWTILARLLSAVIFGRQRSFRQDARACVARLRPPLRIDGKEHIPQRGPCLLTLNHYARPGFGAWWLALALSATVPADIHWVMTAAWTYPDALRSHLITPATRWLFGRIARVYGFTSMPPMPTATGDESASVLPSQDIVDRAIAVRQVLAWVRRTVQPVLALAPEGRDAPFRSNDSPPKESPGSMLSTPLPGSGRFILHLAQLGLQIVPVGAFEIDGVFCLRFGPAYALTVPADLSTDARDRIARETVMIHLAAQLPAHLRGAFG